MRITATGKFIFALALTSTGSVAQDAPKRLFIEPRMNGTRNTTLELTGDLTKSCPDLVSVTAERAGAHLRLGINPGSSILYNSDGRAEHTFAARFTLSELTKEICAYLAPPSDPAIPEGSPVVTTAPPTPAPDPVAGSLPAGGSWVAGISEDKLTGQQSSFFSITASEDLADGIMTGKPVFSVFCRNGKWLGTVLTVQGVIGAANSIAQGQQITYLRADEKIKAHSWYITADLHSFTIDRGSTKDLINSTDARIRFTDWQSHDQTILFSPAGLDRTKLASACGPNAFK